MAQPFGRHQAGPPALAPARARGGDALPHALANDVALHSGERGLDLQEGAAYELGVVERGVQRPETYALGLQLVHESDQFARQWPQAVEVEHDQHVTFSQVAQAFLQPGPIRAGAAATVPADEFVPSRLERVHLAVEHRPVLTGQHRGIPDQIHRSPPRSPARANPPRSVLFEY